MRFSNSARNVLGLFAVLLFAAVALCIGDTVVAQLTHFAVLSDLSSLPLFPVLGMATLNFLDLAKANSNDAVAGIIDDLTDVSPELGLFPVEDLGLGQLNYQTLHRTGRPSVVFAHAGEGFTPSKSELKLIDHECFRFGGRIEAFKHIADNWKRGGAAGYQAYEAKGVMEAGLKTIGAQIWYGVSTDAKGFPGLKAFTPFGGAFTYNATGTTATTASSVYLVKFGENFVELKAGRARNAGGIIELPDFIIETILDANNKPAWAYTSELSSYLGLQTAAAHSVVRICNLTEDSGKGLTDAKLNAALQLFPANFRPDRIFMSKRSCTQLQTSRTVTLMGMGTTRPNQELIAPRPREYDGIPITESDNILNTDAIES
jgi:hypothetical protein